VGFCCHNPCRLQAILRFTRLVVQPDLGGIKGTRDNGMFFLGQAKDEELGRLGRVLLSGARLVAS
jgi:hypothetical protein